MVDDIVTAASVVSSILVIMGILAAPLLFFWGRKYFAERGSLWTPLEVNDSISNQLTKAEHRIRDDFNTVVAHQEVIATQRHEEVGRQLREMHEAMKRSLKRSDEAHDRATEAKHIAERAMDKIQGLEQRIDDRLKAMDRALDRIEDAVKNH